MSALLTTKLFFPPLQHKLVPRPRLIERLDEGLRGPLTLITAPAGYGKTTLMTEWRAGPGRDKLAAWLSLDAGDNDPSRFWVYLISALGTLQADFGDEAKLILSSIQTPPIESVLTVLINELSSFPKNLVLALDDVHMITSPEVYQGLDFLLEHLPPDFHLVLLARADPPLALSRMRVSGQLTEIRARDLSFTTEEAANFMNKMMELELPSHEVNALVTRTEGWIAGLQLAALSMQGRENIADFIATFTGSHHYIADYLVEEVISRQPESTQDFLLKTSILDRMTGSLCNALTGASDGRACLESLHQAHLFTIPLDDERLWYRYHHLFSDLLRNRLKTNSPDHLAELHLRAAQWFEQNDFPLDAIWHAISAKEYEYAAQLIEKNAESMLASGELTTLFNLIDSIDNLVQTHPWLAIQRAWAFTYTGQLDLVEPSLQKAELFIGGQEQTLEVKNILGNIAAIRAYNFALNENAIQAISHAQQALGILPESNLSIRSVVSFILGGAYRLQNDTEAAMGAWRTAVCEGKDAGNLYLAITCTAAQADLLFEKGQLHMAAKTYDEALQLGTRSNGHLLPVAARALAGLGSVCYEWNDLDAASQYANQCITLCRRWGNPDTLITGDLLLSQICQAHGDLEQANELMCEAERLKQSHDLRPGIANRVDTFQIRLWLAQDNLGMLNRWARESGIRIDEQKAYPEIRKSNLYARTLLAQNKPAEALMLVNRVMEFSDPKEHSRQILDSYLIQALAFQATGDIPQALRVLQQALTLAEPEGFVRVFLDLGEPMKVLLQKYSANRAASQYVDKVLAMFPEKSEDISNIQASLLDQLSRREMEVLELIAEGKSNQEIANKLVIALGTVKRHVFNIYNKLDVKSRTECVARARALKLLE